MILSKLRNADGYKNMSRQQLKSIFTTPSAPKLTPRLAPKPMSMPAPRLEKTFSRLIEYKPKKPGGVISISNTKVGAMEN